MSIITSIFFFPAIENDELWSGHVDDDLKVGLIVALGKLGIQREQYASKLIDVMGLLLSSTKESSLKNNVLICLSDLSVRFVTPLSYQHCF